MLDGIQHVIQVAVLLVGGVVALIIVGIGGWVWARRHYAMQGE